MRLKGKKTATGRKDNEGGAVFTAIREVGGTGSVSGDRREISGVGLPEKAVGGSGHLFWHLLSADTRRHPAVITPREHPYRQSRITFEEIKEYKKILFRHK